MNGFQKMVTSTIIKSFLLRLPEPPEAVTNKEIDQEKKLSGLKFQLT